MTAGPLHQRQIRQRSGEEAESPGHTVPFSQPWSLFERPADNAPAFTDTAIRREYQIAWSMSFGIVNAITFCGGFPSNILIVLHRQNKQIVGREYPFGQDSTL